jgi:hypothetical protein
MEADFCVQGNEFSGFVNGAEFLDQLGHYQILSKDPVS